MKVLLRERKRHTARRVASTRHAVPVGGGGGVPTLVGGYLPWWWWGGYLPWWWGVPTLVGGTYHGGGVPTMVVGVPTQVGGTYLGRYPPCQDLSRYPRPPPPIQT